MRSIDARKQLAFGLPTTRDDRSSSMLPRPPENDFRPFLYLFSLGIVAAATVGVLFGVGFLGLAPLRPAAPSADAVAAAPAVPAHEAPSLVADGMARDAPPEPPGEKTTAGSSPNPPSNRQVPALRATAMEPMLLPPAGTIHAKRAGIGRQRQAGTGRRWAAIWRRHANGGTSTGGGLFAGPNPGGGFYGAPNINVGRINP